MEIYTNFPNGTGRSTGDAEDVEKAKRVIGCARCMALKKGAVDGPRVSASSTGIGATEFACKVNDLNVSRNCTGIPEESRSLQNAVEAMFSFF